MKAYPSIEDLRQRARRTVPKMFFDYAEAGSYAQETLAQQSRRPGKASSCASASCSTSTSATPRPPSSARRCPVPIALGPIGLGGMMYGDGEIHACRAAQAAGIPYTLSTMSINSIEDVAGCGRQAVLVPALRDARPRLHQGAGAARGRRQMQRADAHGRSPGARPAPLRRAQRPHRAARDQAPERDRHHDQAGLGAGRSSRASARRSATSPAT